MKQSTQNKSDIDPIDLKRVFKYISKNWYWFPVFIIIFLGLAYVYLQIASPKYEIYSTIIIKEGEKQANFSENAIFEDLENIKTSIKLEDELEKLKSKSLIADVLINHKAYAKYIYDEGFFSKEIDPSNSPVSVTVLEFNKTFKEPTEELEIEIINNEKFAIIISENQKKEFEFGQEIKLPIGTIKLEKNESNNSLEEENREVKIQLSNIQPVINEYLKKIEIEPAGLKSSTVHLRLLDSSPERGQLILDGIVKAYNDQAIRLKNEVAMKTIEFIDERLAHVTKDLEEVERNAENYKVRNNITDIGMDSRINLENNAETKRQIADVTNQIEILDMIQSNINSQGSEFDFIPSAIGGLDATLVDMVSRYNTLQSERQRFLRSVQPNNPQVLSMNEQISSLRRSILENARTLRNNLEVTRRNLQGTASVSSSRVQQLPSLERELIEINRQKEIKQQNYQYLMMKREESALSLEITGTNNAQIIDPATSSLKPVQPSPLIIMGGALAMGIFFPFGLIFVKYKLSSKVSSRSLVEKRINAKILGEVARNENKGVMAISAKSVSPTAEQLRLIRNNLKFLAGKENKVMMVSSSMSKEGKTFISINMATTLSLVDKKIVIVDFDLRRPQILKALGVKNANCVTDYLTHKITDWRELISPSGVSEYLDVIGVKNIISNPAEIINSYKVSELIDHLKAEYDHIIIDTAPIGLVADSYAFSKLVDLMIFVVRMNFTQISQLDQINEVVENKIFKQNFVILNDIDKTSGRKFGYGYYGKEEKESARV